MTEIKKGLIKDLPNDAYHADLTHLSSSTLKLLLTDLNKFYEERILKLPRDNKSSDVFDFGSLLHCMVLEPELLEKDFITYSGWVRRGAEYQQFKEDNPGKIIIAKPQMKKAEALFETYQKNETAVNLIKGIEPEISLFSSIDDVPIKVRADGLNRERRYIVDLKTTGFGLDCDSFKVTMERFHYHLSASLYLKAFEQELGVPLTFYFIVLGKSDVGCKVYKFSDKSRQLGNSQLVKAIEIYKQCISTGDWTGQTKIDVEGDIEEV